MQAHTTTRFAWKAMRGLKVIRLTPKTSELPPSIQYTLNRDKTLVPYFQHAIDQILANGGAILDPKHTDNISINLFNQSDKSSIFEEQSKSDSQLFQILLDSKETKSWDPDLRRLLIDVRQSADPADAFEKMSQRMDPHTRGLLMGLIQSIRNSQTVNKKQDQEEDNQLSMALEDEKNNFLKTMESTLKSTNVMDDLLLKRLDENYAREELKSSYEKHMNNLTSTNPFERVDAEYHTLNPIEAYVEASKLLRQVGEPGENANENEAEAFKKFAKIENDFSSHFESNLKKDSSAKKLTPTAAKYKAMTEQLRSGVTKTLDQREEEHLNRYYSQVKTLPPSSFLSFTDVFNVLHVQPLLAQFSKIQSEPENKQQLEQILSGVRENLKNQWESYLKAVAPLRELNQIFTQEQKSYLSSEEFQLATMRLEKESLHLELFSADFYNSDVTRIVEKIDQIDAQAYEIIFTQIEQIVAGNKDVTDALSIVRKLAQVELKLRSEPAIQQSMRYQDAHPLVLVFHPNDTAEQLAIHQKKMATELSKETDAILSREQFKNLTTSIKKFINEIDSSLNLPREQLVNNSNNRRKVAELYQLFQQFGIKQTEAQVDLLQKSSQNKGSSVPEDAKLLKLIEEVMEVSRAEMISKGSIQEGLLSMKVLEKLSQVLEASPAIREQARNLILPKKYLDRESQLKKSGKVPPKCNIVKKMTISAMPDGFRRKGDRKVVLTARLRDLGLNEIEKKRISHLAGPKYNKDSDTIRIVVRMFETTEEGVSYAKNYLHELIEAAKNDQLQFDVVPLIEEISPIDLLQRTYSKLNEEDEQSADALEKWIMFKETGKKTVGADLTYGEGVRDVVRGDKEAKATKDEYGYNIQEEDEDDEDEFFVPETDEDEE